MNKRIRKYNGSFIPSTQNISDWNSNEELRHKTSTILKNSQYSFIFKLSSPDMQDVIEIYKSGESFNKEERAYECPCHGSKFDYKGNLLESPSIYDAYKQNL